MIEKVCQTPLVWNHVHGCLDIPLGLNNISGILPPFSTISGGWERSHRHGILEKRQGLGWVGTPISRVEIHNMYMYMYMYMCMYVCMRMYVCTYVRMCACMYVRMYVSIYVCMYVRIVRMFVHTYVGLYLCTYVRMYVRTYIRTYVYMYMYLYDPCHSPPHMPAYLGIIGYYSSPIAHVLGKHSTMSHDIGNN